MDFGSAFDLALANWIFFATVVAVRLMASHEGFRTFRLSLRLDGLLLYAEGAAVAVGSWLVRGLFMVLTGHGSVALHAPGRDFWIALGLAALGYLPVTLFEESLFRGYIQDHLTAKRGVALAVMAQALMFGPLHALTWPAATGKLAKVLMVTVLGLAMGTAARNGRLLMWGVGFHHWWNITETIIEGPLSPAQLTAFGGLAGSTYASWVGFGSAVVVFGCARLRFYGRSSPVGRLADATHAPVGVPFVVPGNYISDILPVPIEKGVPTVDSGLTGN